MMLSTLVTRFSTPWNDCFFRYAETLAHAKDNGYYNFVDQVLVQIYQRGILFYHYNIWALTNTHH
jgi:hypothetical protein